MSRGGFVSEKEIAAKAKMEGLRNLDGGPKDLAVAEVLDGGPKDLAVAEVLERLSARLHDIYQKEAHRRGDVRHADPYEDLSEPTKEWDRVLARWILEHWTPRFNPDEGFPPA